MIYIRVPEGMEYKAAEQLDGRTLDDRFVFTTGEGNDISIQNAVYEFYKQRGNKLEINGLILSKNRPNDCSSSILQYRAINNATMPTNHAVYLNTSQSIKQTYNVGTWIQHTLLAPKRLQEVEEKAEAQKLNRRKWGDSPNAN
jgi:hypothetical protein